MVSWLYLFLSSVRSIASSVLSRFGFWTWIILSFRYQGQFFFHLQLCHIPLLSTLIYAGIYGLIALNDLDMHVYGLLCFLKFLLRQHHLSFYLIHCTHEVFSWVSSWVIDFFNPVFILIWVELSSVFLYLFWICFSNTRLCLSFHSILYLWFFSPFGYLRSLFSLNSFSLSWVQWIACLCIL